MGFYLLILFTLLPVVELLLIIRVGSHIGAINTIIILVVTGMAGTYLARLQGFQIFKNIQKNLEQGVVPTEDMLDGFFILAGGVLLVIPGFLSDVVALIFLIPPTRAFLKFLFKKKFQNMVDRGEVISFTSSPQRKKRGYEDYEDANFS